MFNYCSVGTGSFLCPRSGFLTLQFGHMPAMAHLSASLSGCPQLLFLASFSCDETTVNQTSYQASVYPSVVSGRASLSNVIFFLPSPPSSLPPSLLSTLSISSSAPPPSLFPSIHAPVTCALQELLGESQGMTVPEIAQHRWERGKGGKEKGPAVQWRIDGCYPLDRWPDTWQESGQVNRWMKVDE